MPKEHFGEKCKGNTYAFLVKFAFNLLPPFCQYWIQKMKSDPKGIGTLSSYIGFLKETELQTILALLAKTFRPRAFCNAFKRPKAIWKVPQEFQLLVEFVIANPQRIYVLKLTCSLQGLHKELEEALNNCIWSSHSSISLALDLYVPSRQPLKRIPTHSSSATALPSLISKDVTAFFRR